MTTHPLKLGITLPGYTSVPELVEEAKKAAAATGSPPPHHWTAPPWFGAVSSLGALPTKGT